MVTVFARDDVHYFDLFVFQAILSYFASLKGFSLDCDVYLVVNSYLSSDSTVHFSSQQANLDVVQVRDFYRDNYVEQESDFWSDLRVDVAAAETDSNEKAGNFGKENDFRGFFRTCDAL